MNVYMIGIGGIGMSALAQLYVAEGHHVRGSDREQSPTTELLEKRGILVHLVQKAEHVPSDADVVVYSDAVWEDNPERMRAQALGLRQISYFEALGEISKGRFTIAVTGTHGKTTTTAMLADILKDAGKEPTAIIGSIVQEFGSNYLQGKRDVLVVEACEYKDHLLKLSPNILVITNLEWDHTDWFPSLEVMLSMFQKAVEKVPANGVIIADTRDARVQSILKNAVATIINYAEVSVPTLHMIGEFNRMNARAAKAGAKAFAANLTDERIDASLSTYKGTWRRFEYKGETKEGAAVFDDYAHHPTAIRATLQSAREMMKSNTKLIVAFHPHLYSRTRDLMDDFAHSFAGADEVVLAPIYPAREDPVPGVTSRALAEKIEAEGIPARALDSLEEVESYLRSRLSSGTSILTMGAGDIYKVADNLVKS